MVEIHEPTRVVSRNEEIAYLMWLFLSSEDMFTIVLM